METLLTMAPLILAAQLAAITALAWNIPGHMITGAMAYRFLQQENPGKATAVQAMLEKHPWNAHRWRDDIAGLPEAQRSEALFMWAAR